MATGRNCDLITGMFSVATFNVNIKWGSKRNGVSNISRFK